ncbi:hypothetical protein HPP92_001002 [Vanilla planifolia]|uniref:Thioesterase domain-containing protein n=2 Tax=Vanilla planifolia TaxID=51239 RepID=A0A835RYI5_VANPL|nr:hypothetical protein HPP92_001002 [Vanilla planifolia]
MAERSSRESPSSQPRTAELDQALHAVGFEFDLLSPQKLTGHLTVTEICCQPFKVLHGGVTAMIAEGWRAWGLHRLRLSACGRRSALHQPHQGRPPWGSHPGRGRSYS